MHGMRGIIQKFPGHEREGGILLCLVDNFFGALSDDGLHLLFLGILIGRSDLCIQIMWIFAYLIWPTRNAVFVKFLHKVDDKARFYWFLWAW